MPDSVHPEPTTSASPEGISVKWSPDLGETDPSRIRCALCEQLPCDCPPFGSADYFALIDRAHGRR